MIVRFHWYWPFARPEELDWAQATARRGESVLVQVVDRPQPPTPGTAGAVTVVRDLPDVNRSVGPLLWGPSRLGTYTERAMARRSTWREHHFDLVHLHYLNRFTDAVVPLPSPLVMSVHDVVPHNPRLGAAERTILRRVYHRADALVVHHERLRRQLASEFEVDPDVVHVVAHQVFAAPVPESGPCMDPPTVLFFGTFRGNKGLVILIDAIERLRGLDARFVIAGRGDGDLESLARRAAAQDPRVVAEVGFASLERKRELFSEAALVVLPYTNFASQSGVLHDAYGHGRPVVVTDVGALGDSVREDGTGVVAAPGSVIGLADSIIGALEPSTWERYANASMRVRDARAPLRTGERLRQVYDDVLASSD